ncbi:MAG: DUF4335 domain-containing protein [Limnothrix sp. RL_2_0]|nr:DUF4335 domain-containing protein [Limnothrix sp. RL_2_0]
MLSSTITRRYTPPTCSLEIVAKTSALSQWSGNLVIKDLRFELSLDDPRLVTEQKILLSGDRQQLEDLAEVVTDYVQNFLQQTNPVFDFAPTQNIFAYQTTPGASNIATIARPQLETKGLLSHRLHLGRLANEISGQTIQLSATQLFDLANVLEDYSAEMLALPSLTATRNRKNVIRWGAIAASVLLVVGISKTALQMQQTPQSESAVANLDAAAPEDLQQQVIPPNPHSSYTFTPVPTPEAPALTAEKATSKSVQLEPIPDGSPAPISPPPPVAFAPVPAAPPAPPAIANSDELTSRSSSAPSTARSAPAPVISSPSAGAPRTTVGGSTRGSDSFGDYSASAESEAAVVPSGDRQKQAQQYFDDRWQPPETLTETLEYRLTFDEAGAIKTVFPIGKGAELYQSELSFLTPGQPIVSPAKKSDQIMRLVLDSDGTVQTFIE